MLWQGGPATAAARKSENKRFEVRILGVDVLVLVRGTSQSQL